MTPEGRPAGPEISGEVLRLLHGSGTAAFEATLHEWDDVSAMLSQVPQAARRTGFGGLGLLLSALAEHRTGTVHASSALRVGEPGRYQIDHQHENRHGPKTIACDGQRRWQVYDDTMTVGPAEPVRRHELRELTAAQAADFAVNIPSGLRTEPEADRRASMRDGDPRRDAVTPLKVAGVAAREVGKEAAKAARNFLRRLGQP